MESLYVSCTFLPGYLETILGVIWARINKSTAERGCWRGSVCALDLLERLLIKGSPWVGSCCCW